METAELYYKHEMKLTKKGIYLTQLQWRQNKKGFSPKADLVERWIHWFEARDGNDGID